MKKVAVFLDWENIRKGVFEKATRQIGKKVDYNDVRNVIKFIKSFIDNEEEIYRIFIYLSKPEKELFFQGQRLENRSYESTLKFIKDISKQDFIAIREGKLKFRGYDRDDRPILMQKQVDMLIGLDIAHVSYKNLVDRILILSFDTDIIPALKIARINGIQVILPWLEDLFSPPEEMIRHVDIIRKRNFGSIFS